MSDTAHDWLNRMVRLPCDMNCGGDVTVYRKTVLIRTLHGTRTRIVETHREPCSMCAAKAAK